MTTLIETSGLRKSFGEVVAVDGVSLRVSAGEIYGLVGSDGAGKTTTIRLVVGALRLDAGACVVAGFDMARNTEDARAQIGYLSQRFSMYEDLTVLENIRFFAEVRGLVSKEWLPRCLEILDFVGLVDFRNRLAGQLSGGMKQKLGLACALVTRPRILLLDEPTTGVDPVTRQDFWQLLINLVSSGGALPNIGATGVAVLISTPYMDEAARCHRVGFMCRGQIIAEGAPSQLRSRLHERILELRGSPIRRLRAIAESDPSVEAVGAFGDRLHLRVRESAGQSVVDRLGPKIQAEGGSVDYLRFATPMLEDVFIYFAEQPHE